MSLSVITPHYNDLEGLKRILICLQEQTYKDWEWIIVDDCSDSSILLNVQIWMKDIVKDSVKFIENAHKSNASVCRNKGIDNASFENLVFLDADDYIGDDFVANRHIEFNEFAVFPNYGVVSKHGINTKRLIKQKQDLLSSYLAAQFLWQTTCVLWDKEFLVRIGKFDPKLERLQDVELFIRALFASKQYKIIDNDVDFFYCAKPINSKKDIVKKSCTSVNYLISKVQINYNLDAYSQSLIKAYYYACVRGLQRCKNRKHTIYVRESLSMFYRKKYINLDRYFIGTLLLLLYQYNMISDDLFLRFNRYFFK